MESNDESSPLENEQSPSKVKSMGRAQSKGASHGVSGTKSDTEGDKSRDEALRQELASVKKVNEAIEAVLGSLEKTRANMKVRKATRFVFSSGLICNRPSTLLSILLHSC